MTTKINEVHAVETFKSLIPISLAGLKLLALFNGGAAVALLSYLANVAGKTHAAPSMRAPMAWYVAGLFLCGLGFLGSYVTQLWLYNETLGRKPRGRHHVMLWSTVGVACLSLAAFAVGSCLAAWRFP